MALRIVAAVHDPPVWSLPASEVRRIAAALPDAEVIDARTPDERRRTFPEADVILTTQISSDEVRMAPRLKWIHSTAVGVGGVLVPEVVSRDIVVTNVRGVHSGTIAEHAIALVLAVRRRLHVAVVRQREGQWAQEELQANRTPPLESSRMLVVGLGAIGGRVAELAAGLGFRVAGVRRRIELAPPPGVDIVVGPADLRRVLPEADVVVLATPTTRETRAMIGASEIALMKSTAVLVNVARGRLVDEPALVDALERGRIAGAGLDAFVREPLPPDHPLWRCPNVLISPHVAAFGGDYWAPAIDLFLDNVRRFTHGEPLLNVVDKVNGY